jgi:hypothetical protein
MDPAQITSTLQAMAAEHPAAHPYTLALLLESRCGVRIRGAHAKELLAAGHQSRATATRE